MGVRRPLGIRRDPRPPASVDVVMVLAPRLGQQRLRHPPALLFVLLGGHVLTSMFVTGAGAGAAGRGCGARAYRRADPVPDAAPSARMTPAVPLATSIDRRIS